MAVVYGEVSDFSAAVVASGFFLFADGATPVLAGVHFVVVGEVDAEQVFEVVLLFLFGCQPVRHW